MPAAVPVSGRERLVALAAVVLVQLALAAALLSGLRIGELRRTELVSRLIEVTVPTPPPAVTPIERPRREPRRSAAAALKVGQLPQGGSPGPQRSHTLAAPTPVLALRPSAAPAGRGSGSGPAVGSGAGGDAGSGGLGDAGDGGTDLVQIAGAILPSDYPRDLRERGVGGRVEMVFTVGTSGRVASCTVTRSSGVPELDALTCRLIVRRFRYRPSTDRHGRPMPEEVEGEHDWVAESR